MTKGGGGGCTHSVHSRSRTTTDPRIYSVGTEHVGFSPTSARSAIRMRIKEGERGRCNHMAKHGRSRSL